MHVRLTRASVLFLALALVGLGCSKPGAEYLGKWQNTKNNNDQFEIVRNGDNFLVTKSSKSGHGKPITLSCVLRDGILQSTGGFGTATLTYVKTTDHLTTPGFLGGNLEYERVK